MTHHRKPHHESEVESYQAEPDGGSAAAWFFCLGVLALCLVFCFVGYGMGAKSEKGDYEKSLRRAEQKYHETHVADLEWFKARIADAKEQTEAAQEKLETASAEHAALANLLAEKTESAEAWKAYALDQEAYAQLLLTWGIAWRDAWKEER